MGTQHTVSAHNPTYVTGADNYRISFTAFLTPDNAHFAEMETYFLPEHRQPEGYGLAFLESEEHSSTYIGSIQQIEDFRAANATTGTGVLDISLGRCYEFWPQGTGWDEALPRTTWHPDGQGIVTEFDHRSAKVVIYEYRDERDGEQVPMVAFHCLFCHNHDWQDRDENNGPHSRRRIARQARKHIRSQTDCRPVNPRYAEVVTAAANKQYGTNNPVIAHESHCSTTGPCAQIRHLRAGITR